MKKKGLRRIAGLLLAAVLLCGCSTLPGTASSSRDEPKVLTVGCDTYAPLSYLDADGKPTGVDMELATEAFRRMGYEPEFRFINWEEKKDLLESGEIDCIWSSYTMDGREDEYQWAGRYMKSSQVVAVMRTATSTPSATLRARPLRCGPPPNPRISSAAATAASRSCAR